MMALIQRMEARVAELEDQVSRTLRERDAAMADALMLRHENGRLLALLADILRRSERRDLEDAEVRCRIRECVPPSPEDDIPF